MALDKDRMYVVDVKCPRTACHCDTVRDRYGGKSSMYVRTEEGMQTWFGYMEWMSEAKVIKRAYM